MRLAMGACVNTLRVVVFLFNLFFWVAGIILLGLGLWLRFDPASSDYFSLHSDHAGSFLVVTWLLIAAGLIMTFIGFVGCCGAWRLSTPMLACFFFILILVFCLELAAAVIAYYKQEKIQQFVENSMHDTIRNRYASDSSYKQAYDSIQRKFECCGVRSYRDWLSANWDKKSGYVAEEGKLEMGIGATGGRGNGYGRVPNSCCNDYGLQTYPTNCGFSFTHQPLETYAEFLHPKGCADALYDFAYRYLDIAIVVCVIVGALQLFGMVLSMLLCCYVSKDDKNRRYDY